MTKADEDGAFVIRPARADEYDAIARLWMESWVSTGLAEPSKFLLAQLRARIPNEIEKGWTLFVAEDGSRLAAMLCAIAVPISPGGDIAARAANPARARAVAKR